MMDYYAAIPDGDKLKLIRTAEDIRAAKAEKKLGLILGFQSASPIEDDLTHLWIFAQLGVRIIQLTYMGANLVGSGCYEDTDNGLTYLGKTLIREMNRLGILVDLSHCGWKTAQDAIEISTQPVVFTHSNPYEKCPTGAIYRRAGQGSGSKGGVIGITGTGLCWWRNTAGRRSLITDILDYGELAGIDHVGLGPVCSKGSRPGRHFAGIAAMTNWTIPGGLPSTWRWNPT
jgi:membrane dipeptidase